MLCFSWNLQYLYCWKRGSPCRMWWTHMAQTTKFMSRWCMWKHDIDLYLYQSLNSIVHSLINQINRNVSIHDGVHWIVVMWISTTHLAFLYANLDRSNAHLDDGWVMAENMHLIWWYYPKIIAQQINGCNDELVDWQSDWSGSPPSIWFWVTFMFTMKFMVWMDGLKCVYVMCVPNLYECWSTLFCSSEVWLV